MDGGCIKFLLGEDVGTIESGVNSMGDIAPELCDK